MDPLTIMTLFQLGKGISQKIQSNQLERDNERPVYKIPESALESLNQSKYLASMDRLPGQTGIEERLDRNNANTMDFMLQAADNPGKAVSNASKLAATRNDQQVQLGIQAAENKQKNQMRLADELKYMAGLELQQWDWNKRQPWEDAMNTAQQLDQAGDMNMYLGARAGMQLNYDDLTKGGMPRDNRGKMWDIDSGSRVVRNTNVGNTYGTDPDDFYKTMDELENKFPE